MQHHHVWEMDLSTKEKVAIPLRGYVVCNLKSACSSSWGRKGASSQSPYGAMWFAT